MSATSVHRLYQGSSNMQPFARPSLQTSANPTPPLAPHEGTVRHAAKLSKRSSRLPTASDVPRRDRSTASMSTSRPNLNQSRSHTPAAGLTSWEALPLPPTLRTPSLVSGSSVSTFDSPRSNILRRKPSTIGRFVDDKRAGALGIELDHSAANSRVEEYADTDDAIFGIMLPPRQVLPTTTTPLSSTNSDSLYATSVALTGTPSTRFTDSPFSHVPTPSSFSSVSTAPTSRLATSTTASERNYDRTISSPEKAKDDDNSVRPLAAVTSPGKTSRLAQPRPLHNGRTVTTASTQTSAKHDPRRDTTVRQSINPPELAHLSRTLPQKKVAAPSRPSRDGTSALETLSTTSPVVQSDLPPATFHKRTSSRDSLASSSSVHGFRARFGLSPKPAASKDVPQLDTKSVNSSKLVSHTRKLSSSSSQSPATPASAQSTGASPAQSKPSRFAFLTRKPKDETLKPAEKPKREPRKMPVAGTGHERYGRFGFGHRNGSVSPSLSARSPSTESVNSTKSTSFLRRKSSGASDKGSELDAFLRDRLQPVVLRGSGSPAVMTTPSLHGESDQNDGGVLETPRSFLMASAISRTESEDTSTSAVPAGLDNATQLVSRRDQEQGLATESSMLEAAADAEGLWMKPLDASKAPKKWNFLQRLQSSPVKVQKQGGSSNSPAQARVVFDNAAHSALMGAIDPIDLVEVERLLKEDDSRDEALLPAPEVHRVRRKRSSMLPQSRTAASSAELPLSTPSETTLEIPPSAFHTPELGSESPRLPRLSPIGRIPAVVSKRDRDKKMPDVSFSRPFASTQPRPNVRPPGSLYTQIRELASPSDPASTEWSTDPTALHEQLEHVRSRSTSRGEYTMHSASGLFAFPSRKNSDFSYCSTSSDTASWMAYSRMQAMQDEDVWDEYDELMDDASLGKPSRFHKINYVPYQSPPYREAASSQDPSYFGLPPTREPSSALPTPPRTSRQNSNTSIAQSTGMVQSQMYSLTRSVFSRQSAISTTTIDSSRGSRTSVQSRRASAGEANVRSSHTSLSSGKAGRDLMKQDDGVHASLDLKLESLMTSKMLSFGRVLFSPAHHEIRLSNEPRVLILDGLGSDWSYFVAMFYTEATIYNLGPSGKQGGAREGFQQLPNHRNISHLDIGATLPFPKGFFTAAVLRFPVATTDHAYNACIAEFKRVLRPGGHLEVTVLDIDLGNAGDCARKALRGLKTRMQLRQEDVSLRSLSDFALQSIGKRGFEEVQRCVIGVPVMHQSSAYSESGSPEQSRSGSKASNRASGSKKSFAKLVEEAAKQQDEESSTEKMTRSVSRVGRWWFSQCYERNVLNANESIWSDQTLLQECQQQNTSFRLLICCAQKPTQLRRRTMSV